MFQRLTLLGNLGAEPSLKYTPQGTAVTTFSVATSEKFKVNEELKERTTWFRVAVFGKTAETCAEYLKKGQTVLIEGALVGDENGNPKIWTDKDGKPRASYEVRGTNVKFVGKKPVEEGAE